MNIMKARIVWFPNKLTTINFDYLTAFTETCYKHYIELKNLKNEHIINAYRS